jgi:protein-tyrosine-phosphatase
MAEAMCRALGGELVDARSAGLAPLGWVAGETSRALEALGFSARGLSSKGLDGVHTGDVDVVVSLLGQQGLDRLPPTIGTRREAWSIPDPFGEDDEVYMEVARRIEDRVRSLLAEELGQELFSS